MDVAVPKNNIATNMSTVMEQYQLLRGKNKADHKIPFWDVVVITAADADQKDAFDAQLQSKLLRKELPLDCPIHVVADPPGPKLGNGGSTFTTMKFLEDKYKEAFYEKHVLVIHAGGQSRRMPSTSVLGKIFAPIPCGNPMYQMLDVKLAMYLPFLPKMPPGVFICCADDFVVYNLDSPSSGDSQDNRSDKDGNWSFSDSGFTALAHPSTLAIGTKHGVYVVDSIQKIDTMRPIQQCDCLQVLQKPSEETMHKNGAVLPQLDDKKNFQFPDGVKIKGSVAYTDSAFFFAMDIAKKFLQFIKTNYPITCEIDAYGDFLQALGPKATIDYTRHIPNVTNPTSSLVPTREKVFNLLKGSKIQLLLMNSSKFVHIGTTKEYIQYFCFDAKFQEEMSLKKDIFNSWIEYDDDDGEPVAKKKVKLSDVSTGCVMHSILPKSSFVPETAVVEYCYFDVPVHIGQNVIISNCSYLKPPADDNSDDITVSIPLKIPHNVFLHTVTINQEGTPKYVTILFHIDDNLKKAVPKSDVKQLPLLGTTVEDYCTSCCVEMADILSNGLADSHEIKGQDNPEVKGQDDLEVKGQDDPVSLWTLSLHPIAGSMAESLALALQIHQAVTKKKTTDIVRGKKLVSMDTVLKSKNVKGMVEYRNDLYERISSS